MSIKKQPKSNKTVSKNGAEPATSASPLKGIEKPAGEKKIEHIVVAHQFVPDPEGKPMSETRKLAFLDYFNDFLTPAHTCAAVGISLRSFYDWLEKDKLFKKAFFVVDRHLTDRLVGMATARALRGSDNLMMFMLKARDPHYRDKIQAELDPKVGEKMAKDIVNALRRSVPESCPHCKMNLGLSQKVADMLKNLGKGTPV